MLEYHGSNRRYCLFECYNQEGTVFLYSLGEGDPRAAEIDFEKSTSPDLWSEIAQFCSGDIERVNLE